MLVDTHVHVVADDRERYPLHPREFTGPWYETHPCSAEKLDALMHGAGVDRAVLVQGVSAYGFDNRYTLDAAATHPGRFTSVVCTAQSDPDAVDVVTQLVRARAARGFRWFTFHGDTSLSEPRALWEALDALGVPVVVSFLADRLPEFTDLVPTLPSIRFAVDHCAFVDFSRGIPGELSALGAFPNVWLKVSTHAIRSAAAGGDAADAVAELAAGFGGRVMWGSDYPQTHDLPYVDLVELGRRAGAKLTAPLRDAYAAASAIALWPELA